ncbi:MAG: 4-(cytidine 5'-diphospho)-2-C-methyl-D-erythritol kinase [Chitinophagaceae bacterium]|nr:4-(cytidine 5'-diphospho)-2-C-methyl-D-erythritol kinase [Chitinophagaceae bacterium]
MVVFPNCKINLGLHIVSRRNDGFHNLETVFFPVGWFDALEVIHPGNSAHHTNLEASFSGLPVPGQVSGNICYKAWQLLKNDFPQLPPVQMHLHKNIPTGAGLGGGSADGAFMLTLLNKKFNLALTAGQLIEYSLQLGSDCPFFIVNKPCYATGRGEILTPVTVDLSPYTLLIVNPGIHINTGWAFSKLTPVPHDVLITDITARPVETWKTTLVNDFEEPVFGEYPPVKELKKLLYQNGAVYASMTGSGSTVFGLFKKNEKPAISFPGGYLHKWISTD